MERVVRLADFGVGYGSFGREEGGTEGAREIVGGGPGGEGLFGGGWGVDGTGEAVRWGFAVFADMLKM